MNSDIVERLKCILSAADERGLDETECRALRDAVAEIKQLRRERDELRCEVCDWVSIHFNWPKETVAKTRRWDCYKENTND